MKKIIILVFTVFSILLLNVNQAYGFTLNSTYIEPIEASYLEPGHTSEYSVYRWQFYSTPNDEYYADLGMVVSELSGFDSTTRLYSFRSDVLNYIDINYPTYTRYMLPSLQYLVIEDDSPSPTLTFYNNVGNILYQFYYHEITNASPGTNPVYVGFEILSYDYQFYNSAYNHGYNAGQQDGYDLGKKDYAFYDSSNYLTASDYGDLRYDIGYETARSEYGIYINGQWVNASDWGDTRYDVGVDYGQDNQIDWFSWATTFFLMPFKILNIQILPGIRIGYFALFSLLLGVVGWFFFIVGKGGGRRK